MARARAAGASWADIGEAAGVTRESAHERWHHVSVPALTYRFEVLLAGEQRLPYTAAAVGVDEHDIDPE